MGSFYRHYCNHSSYLEAGPLALSFMRPFRHSFNLPSHRPVHRHTSAHGPLCRSCGSVQQIINHWYIYEQLKRRYVKDDERKLWNIIEYLEKLNKILSSSKDSIENKIESECDKKGRWRSRKDIRYRKLLWSRLKRSAEEK